MNDIFENTETMKENEHPHFHTAESVMRGHGFDVFENVVHRFFSLLVG